MVIYGVLMVIYGALMVMYGVLMVIYGVLMVIYGVLIIICICQRSVIVKKKSYFSTAIDIRISMVLPP